ncbi:MAG: hypothetical protein ABJI04_10340, partial [Marinomonas sp.]
APAPPKKKPNPKGPIEQLDLPEGMSLPENIPLGNDGSQIGFDEDGAVITTQVEGVPLEIRLDEEGVAINSPEER